MFDKHPDFVRGQNMVRERIAMFDCSLFTVLSVVVTGLRLNFAFSLAAKNRYDGVEIMPTRLTSIWWVKRAVKRYGVPLASVHGPFWTRRRIWELFLHGTKDQRWDAFIFGILVLGSFERNSSRRIAASMGVPLILHPSVVVELKEQGKLGLLRGLTVWVENDEHDKPFGGLPMALEAHDILVKEGIATAIVVDVEHLAQQYKWARGEDFMARLKWAIALIGDRKIVEFHLCDLKPGSDDIKKGGHRRFGEGELPLDQIISLIRERFSGTRVVVEVSRESMYKQPWLNSRDKLWAEEAAKESIAAIRQF